MDKRQRILIVDDNPNIREGLRSLLSSHQDFEIVGVAGDGLEAVQSVNQFLPRPGFNGSFHAPDEWLGTPPGKSRRNGPRQKFWS